jgi:hypothetical protein
MNRPSLAALAIILCATTAYAERPRSEIQGDHKELREDRKDAREERHDDIKDKHDALKERREQRRAKLREAHEDHQPAASGQ